MRYTADQEKEALRRAGVNPEGIARALDLVRARGVAAQFCLLRDGRMVVDRSVGCRPDALFWTFSASKPYIALLIHRC